VRFSRNRLGVSTVVDRAFDRRRRTTTAYRGGGVADGATSCQLLPIDTADYTMMDNGSVSVRSPARYRGVYTDDQYTYIAGTR